MRRERIEKSSAEKQSSALHGVRIRTITRAYLENVGIQFLSLRQRHRHRHASPAENGRRPVPLTMSNSPPRDLPRSTSRFRGAFLRQGCRVVLLCLHRISAAIAERFGGRARRNLGDSITSDPEMRGPAERREAHYLLSRS